ncbi:EAL domain-containing protein [Montanilutibacter psychrotolerans]|uniref:cyclic-guanylate-specific phosphodiesterase n=1 Tax=Montanilutibacter psychrotolerans TaxID=1327343 RepID=A0A3M8T314_9GAMM|nr:EAL domain-containing protein [Lysobacter psychrotolerans]RNF86126.1 EAL domain-containing protein [Lysobacter psychrotolerans]
MDALSPLKVLLVEDSPADAELVLRALRELARPIEHRRVANKAGLEAALAEFLPDIVLSDFSMPGFGGSDALQIAQLHAPSIPFLFVSGTIGEEVAIEALQRGAADYVLKDNLRRLPSAVDRALGSAREREARQRVELALRDSEERFRTIVESSQDWIWESDLDTRTVYSNGAIENILGYRPEELIGNRGADLMLPEDRRELERRLPVLVAQAYGWQHWRLRWRHRDGSVRVLESTATPRHDVDGTLIGFRGVDQDVTERLQQEIRIRHLVRIHGVLSSLGKVILRAKNRAVLLHDVCTVAVEKGGFKAASIAEVSDGALVMASACGDPCVLAMIDTYSAAPFDDDGTASLSGERALRRGEKVILRDFTNAESVPERERSDARLVGIAATASLPIGNPAWGVLNLFAGEVQGFDEEEIALLDRLVDEIDFAVDFIAKSERLEYLAYHSPVTGLPNRTAFREQLQPMLKAGPVVVAVVDIRRFSYINDSRGRGFGDALLREFGLRLEELATDGFAAHLEADAFVLAYPAHASLEVESERFDACVHEAEQRAYVVEGEEIYVTVRVGISLGPLHGSDGELLERNAMAALTEAGKRGVRTHTFGEHLRGLSAQRLELESDLRRALEQNEFELHYQPKFNTLSRRLVGAEALLRWRHPRTGLVSPDSFIPALEETGLIVPVGRWVMKQALETALRWRRDHHPTLRIAVNVSARELRQTDFLANCRTLLEPHLADQPIDVELTESQLMENVEHSMHLLEGLRDLGCRVAIDDFGTGYSSLNYLARLPVDDIKIDKSFIALLTQSPETMGLVTNIITLAHSLSLSVVAEGVEEEEQAKLLRLLRCDTLQGYLVGMPLNAEAFEAQLLSVA